LGFLLTLLGTLLAAAKTILTNRIQVNNSSPLHPLDLLLRMSPLAFLQSIIYAILIGEPANVAMLLSTMSSHGRSTLALKLAINGALAFGLNYVSFAANKKTSPLTMTVAANVKQCLSIILGVWVFRLQVGWMNAVGIMIALVGGAWYAKVEFNIKESRIDGLGVTLSPKASEKEIV
jgi:Triose-phosphate Transporter family